MARPRRIAMQTKGPLRPRDRRALLPALLVSGALLTTSAALAERQKTVFRSQPTEWTPMIEADDAGSPARLELRPSWTFDGFRAPLAGDPAVAEGLLIFAAEDGLLTGLDPRDGRVVWRRDLAHPIEVGPSSWGAVVYQATREGRLHALDARDGTMIWSAALGAPVTAPPRRFDDRLLVGTAGEEIVALDPRDGSLLVRRPLPGRPTTPPEPAPGAVLIGMDRGVVLALDPASLEVRWRHEAFGAITSPPLYHDGRVYVATTDRFLLCLKLKNGRRRWRARTGAIATARPLAVGALLYLLCYDNDIYVLRSRNSHLLARVRLGHRLDLDPALTDEHMFVVPFAEASLVGLALPRLQPVGRYELDVPGEWFTTAPVAVSDLLAIGYGRDRGRVLALSVSTAEEGQRTEPAGAREAAEGPAAIRGVEGTGEVARSP
ncbi:MAG: PQQ-binding-like beta-propeller repeat protein [Acidobacteriota bacterium]